VALWHRSSSSGKKTIVHTGIVRGSVPCCKAGPSLGGNGNSDNSSKSEESYKTDDLLFARLDFRVSRSVNLTPIRKFFYLNAGLLLIQDASILYYVVVMPSQALLSCNL